MYISGLTKWNLRLQILGFILVIMYSITVLLSPIASGYLIDKTLSSKNITDMMVGICFFCLAMICQPIIGFFKDIIYINIDLNLNIDNSLSLFKKVIYAPMCFFDKTNKGEIISKLINDTKEISKFITRFFSVLIKNIILIFFIIVCMFCISVPITIIVLFILVVFFVINKRLNSYLEDLSLEIAENNDLVYSKVTQSISSIISIKCFCNEERVIEDYSTVLKAVGRANKKREVLAIIIRNFSTLVIMISLSLIYLLGCIEVLNGKMSVGEVVSLGLYYQLIMSPLFEVVGCIIDINNIKPIFERFTEMKHMEEEENQSDKEKIFKLKDINNIHFEHVFFGYNNKVVLDNICLDTPNKGYIGIIGKSGEGKSTLAKLMIGLYQPKLGKISIGNIELKELGNRGLREKIAYVSQEILLFNVSIIDNFKYVNKDLSYQEIVNLCVKVNMHEKIMSTDKKYETIISEMSNMSVGEKQRICIAMALARDSSIVLLDEPTSALDSVNEEIIVRLLKEISRDKLVIVISHKETTLRYSDKVYALQNSRLKEITYLCEGEKYELYN